MYSDILAPGSCPPSPGLAPWAILISIWRRKKLFGSEREQEMGEMSVEREDAQG